MKKKILFLVAAFALFVPSVLAAEPTLEDKNFFANGTSITVTDRTDGVEGALIKWEGGEQLVPATINIFGGSHNSDEKITTTNITIEGGTMHNVFGGGLHKSSVGTATVTVNGGKFTGLVHGGGASSLSGTTCHTWYEGTDKTQATTVVENATLIINGGEFSSKSDAFGGGEGKSYTKKATLLINDTFTGDIRYVTGGGSNGWTDEVNVRLLGGKVKVLQAVNRGFTLNSEMTVDGATVENAYASAEGDNLELGVTESAVLDIVSGKVTNVAPGQSGNPNETAKDVMKDINEENNVFSIGKVINITGSMIEVAGLKDVAFFESVSILNKAKGYVSAIYENTVNISLVEQNDTILIGDKVYTLNKNFKVSFSMDSLGKVIDVFGNDLISSKKFDNLLEFDVETGNIPLVERSEVKREFLTGIAGIDLFYPIGKGQRQLIIGDKKTGKTQICLDMIANQKNSRMLCIYVAIGKTKKEVKQIYYELTKMGAMSYTIIIASFFDDLPAKSYVTPYAATSIAKYFMRQGIDVLVIFDDLKKHADIYRHMSLAAKKVPGRDAYPSDIFYTHARLLENGCQHIGGGSITMIPVVETRSGDITDYISTNIISICDGQLVLSLKKFNKGERPAIDYGLSVSRLGGAVQSREMKKVGIKIKQDLLSYLEIRDIYELVNLDDLGENMKNRMIEGQKILSKLNQYKYSPLTKEEMTTLFDDIKEVK